MRSRFLVISALALGLACPLAPAQARDLSPGAAAAVGVLGGLAVGGAIAGAAANPYYPGRPVYAPPPPPVYAPPPPPVAYYPPPPPRRVYVEDVGPDCYVAKRRFYAPNGDLIIRRERVCE